MSDYALPPPPPHPEAGPPPADGEEGKVQHDPVLVEGIAYACHEANRALQLLLEEDANPHWDDLDEELRASAIDGVLKALEGATPRQMHENWVNFKVDQGWTYGRVKDMEKKEHPCLVPYDDLPPEQQRKDKLFLSIVNAMKVKPEDTTEVAAMYLVVVQKDGTVVPVINPADHVFFEAEREATVPDLRRSAQEIVNDALVAAVVQQSANIIVPNVVNNMMNAQIQMAQQITEAQQQEKIRRQLLLDQKGGHRPPGGGRRG